MKILLSIWHSFVGHKHEAVGVAYTGYNAGKFNFECECGDYYTEFVL